MLHRQKSPLMSSFTDLHLDGHLQGTLPSQVPLKSLFQTRKFAGSSHDHDILQHFRLGLFIVQLEHIDNRGNQVHLIYTNQLRLEVDLIASDELTEEEKLVGWIQVMLVLVLLILRVNFPQLSLHHVQFTKSILFFFLSDLLQFFFFLIFFLIKLLLSQPGNHLHLLLIVLTLSIRHLGLHSFMLLRLLWEQFELLLELLEVQFGIVFPQLPHFLLLFLLLPIFLSSLLHGFLLINLHAFQLQFLWRQLVIGNLDQWELFLFWSVLNQP